MKNYTGWSDDLPLLQCIKCKWKSSWSRGTKIWGVILKAKKINSLLLLPTKPWRACRSVKGWMGVRSKQTHVVSKMAAKTPPLDLIINDDIENYAGFKRWGKWRWKLRIKWWCKKEYYFLAPLRFHKHVPMLLLLSTNFDDKEEVRLYRL